MDSRRTKHVDEMRGDGICDMGSATSRGTSASSAAATMLWYCLRHGPARPLLSSSDDAVSDPQLGSGGRLQREDGRSVGQNMQTDSR